MKTITFTYKIAQEDDGFTVKCLDWQAVYSEGQTFDECRQNAIEVTEMFLERLINNTLHQLQYPKPKPHLSNPFNFQLTFDYETGKYIEINRLKSFKLIKPTKIKALAKVE